jgi:5-formyltetrahydrofolate cyclo-ligase
VTPAAAKDAARRQAFALRAQAHTRHRATASRTLCAYLDGTSGSVVAGYLPIRTEAAPLPAMKQLVRTNRVVVPVVKGTGKPLVFREWTQDCRLKKGAFGVMIPMDGREYVPKVIITPMVAFDERLYRLGYGGGFYNRTLAQLRAQGSVRAVGFAYSAQCLEALPREPTDERLDALLTENGAFPHAA